MQEDFPHRERMKQLRQRQREITSQLDLDKATEGTEQMQPQEAAA
jgi:hypothetical protein